MSRHGVTCTTKHQVPRTTASTPPSSRAGGGSGEQYTTNEAPRVLDVLTNIRPLTREFLATRRATARTTTPTTPPKFSLHSRTGCAHVFMRFCAVTTPLEWTACEVHLDLTCPGSRTTSSSSPCRSSVSSSDNDSTSLPLPLAMGSAFGLADGGGGLKTRQRLRPCTVNGAKGTFERRTMGKPRPREEQWRVSWGVARTRMEAYNSSKTPIASDKPA